MDYGLGVSANSLELGYDCLGTIKYFDGVLTNTKGDRPSTLYLNSPFERLQIS